MSALPFKVRPIRLDAEAYETLRQQVLERDGWRCQLCGSMAVEVHHIERRSQAGADAEENLITLCSACQRRIHS